VSDLIGDRKRNRRFV